MFIIYKHAVNAYGIIKFIFRGVAQLVARLVWDQDAAGSNPVTPTTKGETVFRRKTFLLFFSIMTVFEPEKARAVNKMC